MGRRLAIGIAYWLAFAYAMQFGAYMYGLPVGVGPVLAIPIAVLVAIKLPPRRYRLKDTRRIYRPGPDATVAGVETAIPTSR